MKNLFKSMMLVAVAAMGFTACSKDAVEEVNPAIESKTYTMTFVADAPNTRTSVSINGNTANFAWSEGDVVGFYYVDTNATGKKKKNSKEAVIADSKATFALNLETITGATSYNLGAFYPGDSWTAHAAENPFNNVKVKIADAQDLTDGTFDPKADLMMAKPFMGINLNNGDVKTLEFTRIAAVGKMNLKLDGMVAGEVIKEVVFTLAENTHFNGPVTLDLENSTYNLGTTNTSNKVTLTGELAANAVRTAIFFTCFPGEYNGAYTIEVETDKATYKKEGTLPKPLSFTAGDVLSFNATVGNRKAKEVVEGLEKVELTSADIVAIDKTQAYADDPITITATDGSEWKFKGYRQSTTSNYLQIRENNTPSYIQLPEVAGEIHSVVLAVGSASATSAGDNTHTYYFRDIINGTDVVSEKHVNEITLPLEGLGKSTGYIQAGGPTRVFAITVNYDPNAPTLSLDTSSLEFETAGGSQTITATTTNYTGEITAESNNAHFTTSVSGNVVTVTAPANEEATVKTATITITAGTLSKTVTVSQAAQLPGTGEGTLESPYNVAKALALINAGTYDEDAEVYVKGTITSIDEVSTEYGNATYYIDNNLLVYRGLYLGNVMFTATDQIQVDDEVVICGKLKLYNEIREINSGNYLVSIVRNGEPVLTDRNLAFSSETATATVGGSFTAPTLSGVTDGVVYSSSEESVATVDANTGAVTILAIGTTTITATAAENETYKAGSASYTLTVNPAQGGGEPSGNVYTKVTSTADLTDGQYLIVYEDESFAFDGSLSTLDATSNYKSVTISDNKIAVTTEMEAIEFTIGDNKTTIKSKSGNYIGRTGDKNELDESSVTAYTNTITINNDGTAHIVGSGGAVLRFNTTTGQDRFRYYKSSTYTDQKAITLYKKNN